MKLLAASFAGQDLRRCSWEFVADALDPLVLKVTDQLEILGPVVIGDAVDVMHQFVAAEVSTDDGFHDQPVLANVSALGGERMGWQFDQHVTIAISEGAVAPSAVRFHRVTRLFNVTGTVLQPTVLVAAQETASALAKDMRWRERLVFNDCSTAATTWSLHAGL